MRKRLAEITEVRKRFRAEFVRYGKKSGWKGKSEETVLLKDVIDLESGAQVTGHLWLNVTKEFFNLVLHEGDVLEFDASAARYTKGYVNRGAGIDQRRNDYKLSRPTKVKKLT